MVHQLRLFLIFSLCWSAFAQDERYYRQILNGELPLLGQEIREVQEHQFNVKGASYTFDLNDDGMEEIIQPQKRDGVDWIEIKSLLQTKIFEAKLLAMGGESVLYKVKVAHLSKTTKVLILFLDEGKTNGRRFESTARIFLITFDNNDLTTMHITQGPHHFHEKEGQREQYWRKDYSVDVRDVDKNGVRDVVVEFGHIQRVMLYMGKGEWERL
nr:hypothetical protein [Bdellovibrionales bacterium]